MFVGTDLPMAVDELEEVPELEARKTGIADFYLGDSGVELEASSVSSPSSTVATAHG